LDAFNRQVSQPQIDGSKTGLELRGIVDEVLTMAEVKDEAGNASRAFLCQTINPWSYPAKDRSGRLALVEEPHLGRLMAKIRGPVKPASERLAYRSPPPAATAPTADAPTHSENA